MNSSFVFPGAEEKSFFAENSSRLRRSLPPMADDEAWLALVLLELQAMARVEGIANARFFFSDHARGTEFDKAGPGRKDAWVDWLRLQYGRIRKSFRIRFDKNRYPWQGIFSGTEFVRKQHLASRPLMVAVAAPLPSLLDFINRISWGEARLEIIRLHLEPGDVLPRAWLICRGSYLTRLPSHWAVKEASGSVGGDLVVDSDSELLWQPVNPETAGLAAENELPPFRGRSLFLRKRSD